MWTKRFKQITKTTAPSVIRSHPSLGKQVLLTSCLVVFSRSKKSLAFISTTLNGLFFCAFRTNCIQCSGICPFLFFKFLNDAEIGVIWQIRVPRLHEVKWERFQGKSRNTVTHESCYFEIAVWSAAWIGERCHARVRLILFGRVFPGFNVKDTVVRFLSDVLHLRHQWKLQIIKTNDLSINTVECGAIL